MSIVLPAPVLYTPLSHANLQAGLSTSSISSIGSTRSYASTTSSSATSAASTPISQPINLTLEQIVAVAQLQKHFALVQSIKPDVDMSAMTAVPSITIPASTSTSSPSSVASLASSPSSPASTSQPGSDVHKRIRATKNKQKHNESESRRRDRLRTQFNALRQASECDKKDRIAILAAATDRLKQQDVRVRQYEAERELLIQQLNQSNMQLSRAQLAVATNASAVAGGMVMLGKDGNVGDVGKLAAGQIGWLASLPCAFVGLDGKFLDCNAAFVALTGHAVEFILSSTIFVLTPQHELTPTFMQLKRLLACEIDSWESDRSCLCADGSAMQVHMTMTVAKSRDGKPEFFTLFFVHKDAASTANGLVVANGQQQQQQQQHQQQQQQQHQQHQQQQQQQSTLQLLQPTGLRPQTSGPMGLITLPSTTNLSMLTSQQQSAMSGHPHVSPLSHHHLGAAGLGLATLQSMPQHRFESFQPTYSMQQQHM